MGEADSATSLGSALLQNSPSVLQFSSDEVSAFAFESHSRAARIRTSNSPNLNAVAERFVRSIKESCLDRLILFGEAGLSLRKTVQNFILHYHAERNHQGKGNQLLFPGATEFPQQGMVRCQERLGGLPKYYHREAA